MLERLPDGVRIVRRLRASRADVFDAWVNSARLRSWFGPPGTTVIGVDGEFAVGHECRLLLRDARGETTVLLWEFREIEPPARLVFGWRFGPIGEPPPSGQAVVSISFRDCGDWTEVTLEHTGTTSEGERETAATGWEACFDALAEAITLN